MHANVLVPSRAKSPSFRSRDATQFSHCGRLARRLHLGLPTQRSPSAPSMPALRDNASRMNHSYSQEECCMTRKIAGTCLAAVLGFALSAAAQTPPSTPQTAPTSPYPSSQSADQSSKADKAGKSTKLTGCVQSGTTAGTFELT